MGVDTSHCGNYGSSHSIGSRANQTTGSSTPSPTWSEKGALASASWWGALGRDSVVWNPWVLSPTHTQPCQAVTSPSVVEKEDIKVRRLLVLKKYNMGPMERKQVLRRLMRCWIGFWRTWTHLKRDNDKTTTLNPKIIDSKGCWRRCRGTDWCWGNSSMCLWPQAPGWYPRSWPWRKWTRWVMQSEWKLWWAAH